MWKGRKNREVIEISEVDLQYFLVAFVVLSPAIFLVLQFIYSPELTWELKNEKLTTLTAIFTAMTSLLLKGNNLFPMFKKFASNGSHYGFTVLQKMLNKQKMAPVTFLFPLLFLEEFDMKNQVLQISRKNNE